MTAAKRWCARTDRSAARGQLQRCSVTDAQTHVRVAACLATRILPLAPRSA